MAEITVEKLKQKLSNLEQFRKNDVDRGSYEHGVVSGQIQELQSMIDELSPAPLRQEYMVLYSVTWQPSAEGDDAPTDMDHALSINDDRVVGYGMVAIGDRREIAHEVASIDD